MPGIALIGVLFLGSLITLRRSGGPRSEAVLGAGLLSFLTVVLASMTCGLLGMFRALPLGAMALAVHAVLLLLLTRVVSPSTPPAQQSERLLPRFDALKGALLGVHVLAYAWMFSYGWSTGPQDWDGLAYHLPFIGHLLSTDSFGIYPTGIDAINAYPKAVEFLTAFLIETCGTRSLAPLTQLLLLPLLQLAVYRGTRQIGGSERSSLFAASLVLAIPIIVHQSITAYVDLAFTAMATSAAVLATSPWRATRGVLVLVSLALLLATKATGLVVAPLIGAVYAYRCLRSQELSFKAWSRWAPWFALAGFVGLFWFVRNSIVYHNPVWDRTLRVFGEVVFEGKRNIQPSLLSPNAKEFSTYWSVWTDSIGFFHYDGRKGGFGPLFFIVGLPALIVALLRQWRTPLNCVTVLCVTFVILPFNYNARFAMVLPMAALIALGYVLTSSSVRTWRALSTLSALLAVYAVAVGWPGPHVGLKKDHPRLNTARAFPFDGLHGSRELYAWIRDNVPPDASLALLVSPWIFEYPLWDDDFRRQVYDLSPMLTRVSQGQPPRTGWPPDFIIAHRSHSMLSPLRELGGDSLREVARLGSFVIFTYDDGSGHEG